MRIDQTEKTKGNLKLNSLKLVQWKYGLMLGEFNKTTGTERVKLRLKYKQLSYCMILMAVS